MPTISVIVPVYNVEPYIHRCIDSILAQTYTDFELILVDDGSPDNCGAICDEYAAKDNRIRVIHKENGGLSSARNAGILAATGDYIVFVDSDDYIREVTLQKTVYAARRKQADIVVFSGMSFPNATWANDALATRRITYYSDPIFALLYEGGSRPFAWNKLIKRSLIIDNDLRFDETIKFGEDQPFQFDLFPLARRITYIPDKLYYYRQRPGSLMERLEDDPDRKTLFHVEQIFHIYNTWKSRGYLHSYGDQLEKWIISFLQNTIERCSDEVRERINSGVAPLLNDIRRESVNSNLGRLSEWKQQIQRIGFFSWLIMKSWHFLKRIIWTSKQIIKSITRQVVN